MRLSLILAGSSVVPLDILRAVSEAVGSEADFRFFCLDGGADPCAWVADLLVGNIPTEVTGTIDSRGVEVVAVKPPVI